MATKIKQLTKSRSNTELVLKASALVLSVIFLVGFVTIVYTLITDPTAVNEAHFGYAE